MTKDVCPQCREHVQWLPVLASSQGTGYATPYRCDRCGAIVRKAERLWYTDEEREQARERARAKERERMQRPNAKERKREIDRAYRAEKNRRRRMQYRKDEDYRERQKQRARDYYQEHKEQRQEYDRARRAAMSDEEKALQSLQAKKRQLARMRKEKAS